MTLGINIDQQDGTISFPNGLSIGPSVTQTEILDTPGFANAESQDFGTLPYIHYRFSGGPSEGMELRVRVCFYDQMLLYTDISANFYPPGEWDWSQYSLEIEAKTKHFHDKLLEQLLGKPTKGGSFLFRQIPEDQETLKRPLQWKFPWGEVNSGHNDRDCTTSIFISYGNRREEACWAYERKKGEL